jgi:hypothetical protein
MTTASEVRVLGFTSRYPDQIKPAMTSFDPKLGVLVVDDEIIVTLLGTSYSVTYYKRKGFPGLLAKDIANKDDPRIQMTAAEFLAKAWRAANDKARELGWIV